MSTYYRIPLTKQGILSEYPKDRSNPNDFDTVRNIECKVLENLFLIAATGTKNLKEMNLAYDMAEQAKSITDDMESIEITGEDMALLEKAIELSAQARPGFWFAARAMFKAIGKKEEVKKEVKK